MRVENIRIANAFTRIGLTLTAYHFQIGDQNEFRLHHNQGNQCGSKIEVGKSIHIYIHFHLGHCFDLNYF